MVARGEGVKIASRDKSQPTTSLCRLRLYVLIAGPDESPRCLMVMISDFYATCLSCDLKVPGSSPGVGFAFFLLIRSN